jgi:hypothetical protein
MSYTLSGHFIETCDCTVICPCWVDDEPVGGHCTGLVAWDLKNGKIGNTDVSGAKVVSVSTHGGYRKDKSQTTTVLYIDTSECTTKLNTNDDKRRVNVLAKAFKGELKGPLQGLAEVSGTVVAEESARIQVEVDLVKPKDGWAVHVYSKKPVPMAGGQGVGQNGGVTLVKADGEPKIFDTKKGNIDPLVLQHTALSHELGGSKRDQAVTAQQGGRLELNVGALPGGHLLVSRRSGMRGDFAYQEP